tara:strand:- start:475 stop:783 length:309 start_codon:yes stop_codon:yes gene_type:complete
MHKKTTVICGESDLKPDFEAIGNNPNFVFENDPNFDAVRLFDFDGNIVNVNSWLECANYINGGWTNNVSDFINGEKILFFLFCSAIVLITFFERKYSFLQRI